MKDTVIKETGNSRFLRSSVAEDITFAEFITLLRAGQLPIDLAGINEEGIETLGMALCKENLLNDETETTIWGDAADRTPTNALKAIFETLSSEISEKAKIITGTYTGNGAASRTISLGFTPKAVIVKPPDVGDFISGDFRGDYLALANVNATYGTTIAVQIVENGFTVRYSANNSYANKDGTVFAYIAIS